MSNAEPPLDPAFVLRVQTASAEQLAVILLEGGQRYLAQAIKAMGAKDEASAAASLSRVSEIICELILRLNHEAGGDLVENLNQIYDWWTLELFEAGQGQDRVRLQALSDLMGELSLTWEALHQQKVRSAQALGAGNATG